MENQYMVNWDNLVLNKLVGCKKEPNCMMELDYTMELSYMMELDYMIVSSLEWLCMIDPSIPVDYCMGLHKMAVVGVEVAVHKLELSERKFVGHTLVLVLVHRILHIHNRMWSWALEQRLLSKHPMLIQHYLV
jgi:hypothetical protein